jgi:hypothetical protein
MFTTHQTCAKSKTSTKYLQLVVSQPVEKGELGLVLRLKSEVWPFEEEEEVVVVVEELMAQSLVSDARFP